MKTCCTAICIVFFIFFTAKNSFADVQRVYTLPELKKIILIRNADNIIASNRTLLSKNMYQAAVNKFFWPYIRVAVDSPLAAGADNIVLPATNYYLFSTNYALIGTLTLEEKLPWDMLFKAETKYQLAIQTNVRNYFSGSLSLSQSIFKRNDDAYTADAAQRDLELALRTFVQNERDLVYTIDSQYYDTVTSEITLASSRRRVTSGYSNTVMTGYKYKAGLINEITYLRLDQSYSKTLADFESQKLSLRSQKSALALLMDTTNYDFNIDLTLPVEKVRYDKQSSIARSISNDLTLQSIALNIWKEKKSLENILDDYRPNGTASVTLARDFNANYDLKLSLNLSSALFDRMQSDLAIEASVVAISNLNIQIVQRQRTIQSTIERIIDSLDIMETNITIYQQSFVIAKKSFDINMERFNLGVISTETMVTTEDDYYATELSLVQQKVAYLKAISQLENKFWMVRAAAPTAGTNK
ncbi:MAG: TolC family protein [Spirochaetes bacterium]|nr:TolC family protein [Spirochaetota bacterium]